MQADLATDCLNEYTLEILASKQDETKHRLLWFYDIDSRACRQIAAECLLNADGNSNRFSSRVECQSQCIPNVNEDASHG